MALSKETGYEPLYELKPVADGVWIVDGGWIRFYCLPFPTRMTVVRLKNGGLWIHSPVLDDECLVRTISSLGTVEYIVAPNCIHYEYLPAWQRRFPAARVFISPGTAARARSKGIDLLFDTELGDKVPDEWKDDFDQLLAESKAHREVVFFHRATQCLILTDLIENLVTSKMPLWTRPFLSFGGVAAPNGGMPADMALSFKRSSAEFRSVVLQLIAWDPKIVIIAHGQWFNQGGAAELRRAFSKFLT